MSLKKQNATFSDKRSTETEWPYKVTNNRRSATQPNLFPLHLHHHHAPSSPPTSFPVSPPPQHRRHRSFRPRHSHFHCPSLQQQQHQQHQPDRSPLHLLRRPRRPRQSRSQKPLLILLHRAQQPAHRLPLARGAPKIRPVLARPFLHNFSRTTGSQTPLSDQGGGANVRSVCFRLSILPFRPPRTHPEPTLTPTRR